MFEPGDRVVCVDVSESLNGRPPLVLGEIYTVSLVVAPGEPDPRDEYSCGYTDWGVDVEESPCPLNIIGEFSLYYGRRFRKLGKATLIDGLLADQYHDERDIKRKPVAA